MTMLTEFLGYLAIAAGFFAATKKDMGGFRLWHLLSNFLFIFYGFVLASVPLVVSGVVFCGIHAVHLYRMRYPGGRRPGRA
ncbi:MAG: YgjV family protein [Lewinella sp.]